MSYRAAAGEVGSQSKGVRPLTALEQPMHVHIAPQFLGVAAGLENADCRYTREYVPGVLPMRTVVPTRCVGGGRR